MVAFDKGLNARVVRKDFKDEVEIIAGFQRWAYMGTQRGRHVMVGQKNEQKYLGFKLFLKDKLEGWKVRNGST